MILQTTTHIANFYAFDQECGAGVGPAEARAHFPGAGAVFDTCLGAAQNPGGSGAGASTLLAPGA